MRTKLSLFAGLTAILLTLGIAGQSISAAPTQLYEVTVTNITKSQIFTPLLVANHNKSVKLFSLGQPASDALAQLAEGGDIKPLDTLLKANKNVFDTNTNGGVLLPGQSVTIKVKASVKTRRISLAAMLVPTNDAFVALNNVRLPIFAATYIAYAYDAGTEPNDELCAHIPGPPTVCTGQGYSPNTDGEGYVHIHNGIHGIGDLDKSRYDWNNPVAKVVIRRVK